MPKQKNNIVMKSVRGMFGKQVVFKSRGGETYVSAPPEVDENRKPTTGQLVIQDRFKNSTEYAIEAIQSADTKKVYQKGTKGNQSAYNVAFKDAFNVPEVIDIIAQGYQGVIGNIIVVQAKDDFKVNAVKISIHGADGQLVEEGAAVAGKRLTWTYTVTLANANITGTKIKATATDLPGNEGSLEVTL